MLAFQLDAVAVPLWARAATFRFITKETHSVTANFLLRHMSHYSKLVKPIHFWWSLVTLYSRCWLYCCGEEAVCMLKLILYTYYVPKKSNRKFHFILPNNVKYLIQEFINEPLLVNFMEEFTELHWKHQRVHSSLPIRLSAGIDPLTAGYRFLR